MKYPHQGVLSQRPRRLSGTAMLLLILLSWLQPLVALAEAAPGVAAGGIHRFTILHTSDEHSNFLPLPVIDYHPFEPNPSQGGIARVAALVNEIRSELGDEPVLLFSSGDFVGGSPFAWLILEGYAPELQLMQHIGYTAATIGNHEFDYNSEKLAEYLETAGYPEAHQQLPLIISNLKIPEEHPLEKILFPEHRIIELPGGLRIGVFGLLGPGAYALAPYAKPVTINDPVESAREQVALLREAGADVVIALSHSDLSEDRKYARKVNGIDLILGGHVHKGMDQPERIGNTLVFHSGYYMQHLGRLALAWDASARRLELENDSRQMRIRIPINSDIPEDPATAEIVGQYLDKLNEFITRHTDSLFTDALAPVMQADYALIKTADMQENVVGNFVTDAMRLIGEEVTGRKVDIAIQANGVIRGNIVPGQMAWSKGQLSFFDLVSVSGLGMGPDHTAGYPMVSIYFTAQEVWNMFEVVSLLAEMRGDIFFIQVSGANYHYNPGHSMWLKIPVLGIPIPSYRGLKKVEIFEGRGVQHQGPFRELDPAEDRLYHIVADHYLTSFLPLVGQVLPRLAITLRDQHGQPIAIDSTIIRHASGQEFKVWEALARYAASFETAGTYDLPVLPDYYRETQGRVVQLSGIPLWVWSYSLLILLLAGIAWLSLRIARRLGGR